MEEPVTIMRTRRLPSRRPAVITCLAAICLLLAGLASVSCGTAAPARPAAQPAAHQHNEQAVAPPSTADAALQLQALLGHHTILAAELMRGRLRGDDDFTKAAAAAAQKNTEAMAGLVSSLFGAAAAS